MPHVFGIPGGYYFGSVDQERYCMQRYARYDIRMVDEQSLSDGTRQKDERASFW